jgi:invasion protein IalB
VAPIAAAQQPQQSAAPSASNAPQVAPARTPAAGDTTAGETPSGWIKLCDRSAETQNKEACLTTHERIDGDTGLLVVGAAVRKVEGDAKQQLIVKISETAAMALPAGVGLRVDDGKIVRLAYTSCYAMSCEADTNLTTELFNQFRTGKQLRVTFLNLQGKTIGLIVPLTGFSTTYDGPPVDTAKYQDLRRQLMAGIRKRQMELANKAKESQAAPTMGEAPSPSQPEPDYPDGPPPGGTR